jgi:class 3 adenylate cyclase
MARTESEGNFMPEEFIGHLATHSRNACTPDVAVRLAGLWFETDVRGVLGAIAAPTLLMAHRDQRPAVEEAEFITSLIPSSELRLMPGSGWTAEELPAWIEEIREFVGVSRAQTVSNTVLATVLFTDIVGSTERQASLGDAAWKELISRHHAIIRGALKRHGGVEIDTAGDGFYATFEGPARAVRCALDLTDGVHELGIEIRIGIHAGECELIDTKVGGISVTTGKGVAEHAGPSEVLVSQTVKDLVAGSGLTFDDAGEHELKGVFPISGDCTGR